jgi:ABC-2 type transport system permease protein
VGVVISPDFSEDVDKGDSKVMILVDGSDPFVSLSAYLNANIVAQQYSIDVLMEKVQQATGDTTAGIPLTAKVRILYNPDLNDIWFIIPGLIAVIMQTMAIALVVGAIVKEREVGTMEQILVTPIEPIELLIGKIIPNFVLLMGNLAMILFFSMVVFKVPFRGNILIFLLCVVVYLLACMGLGLLISTTAENQRQAFQVNIFILLVGLVVSGFIFPRSTLPRLLNWLGYLFPLTYFIPIARGIISKGIGLTTLWPMVVELLVYSTVIIFISAKAFRQSID